MKFQRADTEDGAADEMLTKVLGKLLDPALAVGKIQLAPSPSSPNLVLPSLSCQGTDTLHRSGSTVRRDYTDIWYKPPQIPTNLANELFRMFSKYIVYSETFSW